MEMQIKADVSPKRRFAVMVSGMLVAVLLLTVPVFALVSVVSGGSGLFGGMVIESSDDRITNGLQIVDQDARSRTDEGEGEAKVAAGEQSGETVLRGWRYTRDRHGSPGH